MTERRSKRNNPSEMSPTMVDALLGAALLAMAEHGYHGTSIRDIAERAEVSSASIYHHFGSKQELLAVLMRRSHEDHFQRLQRALLQASTDPADRLSALVRTHVQTQVTFRHESFVGNTELRALEPHNREIVVDKRDAIQRLFDDVIGDGVDAGKFGTAHGRAASRAIVTMCTAVSGWFQPGGRLDSEQLADTYVGLSLAMVESTAATT